MFLLALAESSSIQLIPDGTLFIHIALVLLMIWVLNRTLFRPVNAILEKREKNSGGMSGEADSILKEAAEKSIRYERGVRDARSQGYDLIELERSQAANDRQEKVATAKSDADRFYNEQKQQIENDAAAAREEVARDAEKTAEKITATILKA